MRLWLLLPLMLTLAGCPAAGTPVAPAASAGVAPSPSPTPTPSAGADEAHNSNAAEQTACGLLRGAAVKAVEAVAEGGTPPALSPGAWRYDIGLPGSGAEHLGLVSFDCPTAAEWSLFLDRDVYVIVRTAKGQVVPGAKLRGSKYCAELAIQRVYELEPGTYTLDFGPSEAARFGLAFGETHPGGAGMGRGH